MSEGDYYNIGEEDLILIKYDQMGNELWKTVWGGNGTDSVISVYANNSNDIYVVAETQSTDLENIDENIHALLKYSVVYDFENIVNEKNNGTSIVEQQGKYGIVRPMPNEGYEVDKIVIKDKEGNILDLEVTKLEDGTYSFELYTDVSVEVIYKESIENPKTGLFNYIGLLLSMLVCSFISFWFIMRKDEKFEL
jgi:hypothetical protein